MKATREEMEWLLNDTVRYYKQDVNRRCSSNGGCFYSPKNAGKEGVSDGCAVGRWMTPQQQINADSGEFNGYVFQLPEELIPNKLKKYNIMFLADIQRLHDGGSYWTLDGLSSAGVNKMKNILVKINEGAYD